MFKILRTAYRWFFGGSPYPNLSNEEYEEYEFLGACMDWRSLTAAEADRYIFLDNKRMGL